MTITTGAAQHGPAVSERSERHDCRSQDRPTQIPLFQWGPSIWDRAHRTATWQEIARALPANLGVELTAEHGWRVIVVPAETRRALEAMEVTEGEVIPDALMRERRRWAVESDLMLAQARAVLRSVQAEHDARTEAVA